MNFEQVKREVIKFTEERNWDQFHTPENLAKSISIEAAELLECFQWSPDYDKQAAEEELADIVNYCILMADKMGINIEDAVMDKIAKNREKYDYLCKTIADEYLRRAIKGMLAELCTKAFGRKAAIDNEIQIMRERLVELEKEREKV